MRGSGPDHGDFKDSHAQPSALTVSISCVWRIRRTLPTCSLAAWPGGPAQPTSSWRLRTPVQCRCRHSATCGCRAVRAASQRGRKGVEGDWAHRATQCTAWSRCGPVTRASTRVVSQFSQAYELP